MFTAKRLIPVMFSVALISGCSSESEPPMKVEDSVFSTQAEALEEARAVEGMLLEQHADRDEELRRQGG